MSDGSGASTLVGGGGNDQLTAGGGNDILVGGTGNDLLAGNAGNDVYRFSRGDGQDVVNEGSSGSGTDAIEFDATVAPGDIEVFQEGDDLVLKISGTEDRIRIAGTVSGGAYRVEEVRFRDALGAVVSTWSHADLLARIISAAGITLDGDASTTDLVGGVGDDRLTPVNSGNLFGGAGNDEIIGTSGADTLVGGSGNDSLSGGAGDDVYRFSSGFGQDEIYETSGGSNIIEFDATVSVSDVIIELGEAENHGGDKPLIVRIAGSSDRITIHEAYRTYTAETMVDEIRFADGTIWNYADMVSRAVERPGGINGAELSTSNGAVEDILTGGAGDDTLSGGELDDELFGGAGNDNLEGGSGDDVLVGGSGNDMLRGGLGDDIYRFSAGFGQDWIEEQSIPDFPAGANVIEFDNTIATSDVRVVIADDGYYLAIDGTEDRIRLSGIQYIAEVRFADGTIWSTLDLETMATSPVGAGSTIQGSVGDDSIFGGDYGDILLGGGGNDSLAGGGGDDILAGGTGNDRLDGGFGNDIYRFARGDGRDEISESSRADGNGDNDILEFGAGIATTDIRVERLYESDLGLRILGTEDFIYITNGQIDTGIKEVHFADGTVWTIDDVRDVAVNGTPIPMVGDGANDNLSGTAHDDSLVGLGGDDILSGGGGNDSIEGGAGDDILIGGAGNDLLSGGLGDDEYRFSAGFGQDAISNYGGAQDQDEIVFDSTIAVADVTAEWSVDGRHLVLRVAGSEDRLTLQYVGDGTTTNRPPSVRFADGTIWTGSDLQTMAVTAPGRQIFGPNSEDSNHVTGTAFDDRLSGFEGNELLSGGAGDDWLRGGDGDDILIGGTGNDRLIGDGGSNIFRFSAGFGQDEVESWDYGASAPASGSIIEFDETIIAADVSVVVSIDGTSLILKVDGTEDRITLLNALSGDMYTPTDVHFFDGTIWTNSQLLAAASAAAGQVIVGVASDDNLVGTSSDDDIDGGSGNDILSGGAGSDYLVGGAGDDILIGGTGTDYLDGGEGSNIYRFGAGFGQDTIYADNGTGVHRIEFDATINSADVTVYQGGDNDPGLLTLKIAGTEDRISLYGTADVHFSDGTQWSFADLQNRALPFDGLTLQPSGTALDDSLEGSNGGDVLTGLGGNDSLYGNDGDDSLTGGTGDDYLDGGYGSDVYHFSRGFGQDRIYDTNGESDTDIIQFDATIAPEDVIVESPSGDGWLSTVYLKVAGTEDRIRVDMNTLGNGYEVHFADGTIWTGGDIADRAVPLSGEEIEGDQIVNLVGTPLDDVLNGDDRPNILDGGAGNDRIFGGGLNETPGLQLPGELSAATIAYFGSVSRDLVNGLGGTAGFGEQVLPVADDSSDQISIPAEFARGAVVVGGTPVSSISVNSNGAVSIGSLTLGIWAHDVDQRGGAVTPSSGGTSTGANRIWYDFDATENIITITWDDVGQYNQGTVPNAFQVQVRILDDGDFDILYRYESLTWSNPYGNRAPFIEIEGSKYEIPLPSDDETALDTSTGNLGVPGVWAMQIRGDVLEADAGGSAIRIDDTIIGGAGDDWLEGGAGTDLYRFSRGFGQDVIYDIDLSADGGDFEGAVIEFDNTIASAEVLVESSAEDGDDLVLRIAGTDDRITIREGRRASTGVFEVRFADGSSWNQTQTLNRLTANPGVAISTPTADDTLTGTANDDVLNGLSGNDTLVGAGGDDALNGGADDDELFGGAGNDVLSGGDGNDVLVGGAGSDTLDGGTGDDIYRFARGDGQDSLTDSGGSDRIEFAAGIAADDIEVRRVGASGLMLRIKGSDDRITLTNVLASTANAIELVTFADGTSWTFDDLKLRALLPTDGDDILTGTGAADTIGGGAGDDVIDGAAGHDILAGGSGNDTLTGGEGNDDLTGGTGNDRLNGGNGDDVYRFALGDGQDIVTDTGGIDSILFGEGISAADIVVAAQGSTGLIIKIAGTNDRLTLTNALSSAGSQIETIGFADGTIWTHADLIDRLTAGTAGDDNYVGTAGADKLVGQGGNDSLAGNGGNDRLSGGSGDDRLDGGAGSDELAGGTGDDLLVGGTGGDLYIFAAGDGTDHIEDRGDSAIDRLRIDGHVASDARFSRTGTSGDDLTIRFSNSTDRIVIRGAFLGDAASTIEEIAFSNGGMLFSLADITARLVQDANVTGLALLGSAAADNLVGGTAGDLLIGGAGADTLDGGDGDDIFDDVSEDDAVDMLTGGAGRDTYRFLPIYDVTENHVADIITDFTAGNGGDIIRLSVSNPNPFENGTLRIAQDGADAVLVVRLAGGADKVILRLTGVDAEDLTADNFGGLPIGADNSIRIIDTDDGHILEGGPLNDVIFGNGGSDTIHGLGGDDRLAGGADNDLVEGGFGNDWLAGEGGHDVLIGGEGSDILSGGTGNDILHGGDIANARAESDVFDGGVGDDQIFAGTGNDSFHFTRGDGRDVITDLGGNDRIVFAAGIAAADVEVVQFGGVDIELRISADGGRIRITGGLVDSSAAIEEIVFADGTIWSWADVLTRSMAASSGDDILQIAQGNAIAGLGGNDILRGTAGNDTLTGGTGDDRLEGGAGNDIYVFHRGDGQDSIVDAEGVNILQLGAGIATGEVRLVRGGATLSLEIIGGGDRIELGTDASFTSGIQEVQFADGTIWSAATLKAMALAATGGDDRINGTALADTLSGGAGDDMLSGLGGDDILIGGTGADWLRGGDGNDLYRFAAGDGVDRIADTSGAADAIEFAAGIAAGDIRVDQSADGKTITLRIVGTGDRIAIEDALGSGRIEEIRFSDGTIWTTANLLARIPTSAGDIITGDGSANILVGGAGNDLLAGLGGDDVYRFARGDGRDTIREGAASANDVLEVSGYELADLSFARLTPGSDDLLIRFAGDGDEIIVRDGLANGNLGIERIVLTDSDIVLGFADIRGAAIASQQSGGDDWIVGSSGTDVITGGAGNDTITGNGGIDTFIFRAGDGMDRIEGFSTDADVLRLEGLNPSDLASAVRGGPDSLDLVLTFKNGSDRITLTNALASGNALTIAFADGTVWNLGAMRARAISDIDGSGNDKAYGFDGADSFAARAGDDLLAGGAGADSYAFGRGSGKDIIQDSATSAASEDFVQIVDFTSEEASITRLFRGSESIVLTFESSTADSLTIIDALAAEGKGIERIRFADGVEWTKATMRDLVDNRAPTAVDDGYYTLTAGQSITILAADLLRNDLDADGDTIRIVAVDGGANGVATINAQGNIVFTANGSFYGPTSLAYTISDGRNAFDTASVDIRIRPVATAIDDTGFTVAEDGSITIRVERLLSNDLDGDRMIVGQVYGAKNGTVSLSSDGNISFTPNANFNGLAEFSYLANTPEGGAANAKVTINVTAVNDAPVARNDGTIAGTEGVTMEIDPLALIANDSDVDGDILTIQSVISNPDIAVSIGANGMISVRPRDYFWGNTHFDYVVKDPSGATSTARVNLYFAPVNDAPQPVADRIETTQAGGPILEDNPIVINALAQDVNGTIVPGLLSNDLDPDGDPLTIVAIGSTHGGSAQLLENQTILFTPTADFNGDAWFDYRVSDGQGGFAWARATIAYQPVNDRPIAGDDHYSAAGLHFLRGSEDVAIEIPIAELLKNDRDPEGLTLTFLTDQGSVPTAVHGDISFTNHGTIIFTPDADYWGEASFYYLVTDAEGLVDDGKVTLWFDNVSDAPPVANDDFVEVLEDVPVVIPIATLLANDTDIDRDPIRFVEFWADQDLNGRLDADGQGNIIFTPNLNATATTGFFYRITDDTAEGGFDTGYVALHIVASADDPTVVDDLDFTTPYDIPLVLRVSDLLANDFDVDDADRDGNGIVTGTEISDAAVRPHFVGIDAVLDPVALALGQNVSVGTAEIVTFGGVQFVVVRFNPGYSGEATIQYRIADATGREDTGFVHASVDASYSGTLSGTAAIDYLVGNALGETIRGLASDDYILALGGNDRIEAGGGDDHIYAGDGDDIIDGGFGGDTIDGGAGFDTVIFEGSNVGVRADLESRVGQGGTAAGDLYISIEALVGTAFNDQLGGDAGDNRLEGAGGNDRLEGRAGDDTLIGGAGHDILQGGAGADILDGGDGIDTADYFDATDSSPSTEGIQISLANGTASGGDAAGDTLISIENVIGTDYDDLIEGDAGANRLEGGRGDDILIGGGGDDVLIGGRGADTLIGGDGVDIADYSLSAEGITIDLADALAGGGDALGDTLSGIEIVQGSYHDDIMRGDAGDNRLRGSLGADIIDGRGGFDIADYATADEAVTVNLALGQGLAGEAEGDTLIDIEMLVGSVFGDHFIGSSDSDTFDGGYGQDLLEGGYGSDTYLLGFDSDNDRVVELGDAADIDRVRIKAGALPKDVSLVRQGDDLLIELENVGGVLTFDTMLIEDHFLGTETGIEEIIFDNGMVWDRAMIEDLARTGRFNAEDDVYLFGVEDEVAIIDPASLLANDAEEGVENLVLVSVNGLGGATASIGADGKIAFQGAANFNGQGYFEYTVADEFGRQSTATVRVNIAPVNDAPVAVPDAGAALHGVEDEILRIRIDTVLKANDYDIDDDWDDLRIVGIAPLVDEHGNAIDPFDYDGNGGPWMPGTNLSARISGEYLEIISRTDFYGFAGFSYILEDPSGARSTAPVELYFDAVNDAPRGSPDIEKTVRFGRTTSITVAELLETVYDVEEDGFSFVGLHEGIDGDSASNGTAVLDAANGTIAFTPDAEGNAAISFDVIDARGASATLTYHIRVIPANYAPTANTDRFTILEDRTIIIDPSSLLANDRDADGDTLTFLDVERFATNGKVSLNEAGQIVFRARPDFNGAAGFEYSISDGHGGTATGWVAITILPENDGAILRNDLVTGLEDQPLFVIPAEAFGNDIEPEGDVLFFRSAGVLGEIAQRYLSADYTVIAKQANGEDLPSWLSFDAAGMTFTGTVPAGASLSVNVIVKDPAGGNHLKRFSFDSGDNADLAGGLSVENDVLGGFTVREAHHSNIAFGADDLAGGVTVGASLAGGDPLPFWLVFDAATLSFSGTPEPGATAPIDVVLTFTRPGESGEPATSFTDTVTIDPADLASGVAYQSGIALFDVSDGSFAVSLEGGRALPDWLAFDLDTMTLSLTGTAPGAGADPVRLQLSFTPDAPSLPNGSYAASTRGFTLEFVIDPNAPLDPAINALLQQSDFFKAQGLFGIDLGSASAIAAKRESEAPLPDWLGFDGNSLGFDGTPPPAYIGGLPIRLDVTGNGGTLPNLSIITDVIVDTGFSLVDDSAGRFGLHTSGEQIDLNAPEDFNGSIAISYTTIDEKGGISQNSGVIVFNVLPTAEKPDAVADSLATVQGEPLTFALMDLLRNDREDDGDYLRVKSVSATGHGTLVVNDGIVEYDAPSGIGAPGATWSAKLADGSDLPAWMSVDAATGKITATVPFDFRQTLGIVWTATLGGDSASAGSSRLFDGKLVATVTYTPEADWSGNDGFTYVITDDRQGDSSASVSIAVEARNEAPYAVADSFSTLEETPITIAPAALLANDRDVDGDPIRFVDVLNPVHGTIGYDVDGNIVFTPDADFSGAASFDYIITDDVDGSRTGTVTINVQSTNHAPSAVADQFTTAEDTPFEFTAADLIGNDTDLDGDTLSLVSLEMSNDLGRIQRLPGGRYSFIPKENASGTATFRYTVSDGRSQSSGTFSFEITPVNDAPNANADGIGTGNNPDGVFVGDQDTPLVIDLATLLANDRDVEGDSFTIVELLDGDNGTVVMNGNTAVFTPHAGYYGNAAFSYRVTDANGADSIGHVSLTILPEFNIPIAVSDLGFGTLEDMAIDIDPAELIANDYDPEGDTLSFVGFVGTPANATITALENGHYRITPAANFNGKLTLTYAVTNSSGFPVTATVEIDVLPVNDAPVAVDDMLDMIEDQPLTLFITELLSNDVEPDSQALLFNRIVETHGLTVTEDGLGRLVITPDANFNGAAWFDYEVTDSYGLTDIARVAVNIAAVNDAPVIGAIPLLRGVEDQPFSAVLPSGLVSDADGDAVLVEVRGVGGTALPSWLSYDRATRTFTGTPPANFNGTVELEILAADQDIDVIRQFAIVIDPVNDAPVAALALADQSTLEDQAIDFTIPSGSFTDIDSASLVLSAKLASGEALPTWLGFDDGHFTGQPPANFNGALDIVVTASDGSLTASSSFRLTVSPVNDAPVLVTGLADISVAEDTAIDILIPPGTFADPDGDSLTLTARLSGGSALPAWLSFDGERLTGQPPAEYSGQIDIEIVASDGALVVADGFRLTISSDNDAPVVSAPLADVMVAEDHAVDITLPAGVFSDPDGDALTLSAKLANGDPLPSWLSFDAATRRFTGQPPLNYHGAFAIAVTASDGTLSVSDSFELEIVSVNDAPTVASALADIEWTSAGALDVALPAGSFADVDGDTLTITARLANGYALPGWLSFDGARFTGTPPAGFTGPIDIEVFANDGLLAVSDIFRLTVSVGAGGNDAPVVINPIADAAATRGDTIDIAIPSNAFGDPDGDALTYSATMADGSALPAWLTFAGGHLTGTIPGGALGDYNIRITASDGSLTASDVFTLKVGMLATGPERTPSQWALFGAGNDRIIGRGSSNGHIGSLGGDDYITVDGWSMSVSAGDGNDIIELMGDSGSVMGDAGADTFIFDGFSLLGGDPTVKWTTITDFQNGVDRIGIVNGTGGIGGFADLAPYMIQVGAHVDIALKGLPVIRVENILLADLDASDFMFGNWLTDGGFGAAPAAGSVPYPTTTVVKTFAQRDQLGNASERVLAYGSGAVTVDAMDGNDHITSDGWNNTIYGGRGNDVIEIFGTSNRIMGGAGYDYFVFDSFMVDFDPWEELWATITDYHDGADKIVFLNGMSGLTSFADLVPIMSQDGDDVRIAIGDRPDIIIEDIDLASLDASDFLFVNQPAVVKALRSNGAIRMGSTIGVSTVTANGFTGVTVSGTANGDILDFSSVDLVNITRVQGAAGDDVITGNAAANILWGGDGNDRLYGGDGNDSLVGDAGDDILSGGAGNDTINGSGGTDTVDYSYATANLTVSLAITAAQTVAAGDVDTITNVENLTGGSGNDTLTGTTTANTIRGGDGDDTINAGRGNDIIDGGAGFDKAIFAGVSTTYSLSTSGGIVSIVDNATSADGNDGTDQLIGIEQLVFKNNVTVNISSPIILDLDGNGVTTLSAAQSSARYDMDGDGLADDTSWMGTGEGLLFLDRNGDGKLTNAGEFSFVNDVPGATSDLVGLRAFDSNKDGILSSADAKFADFRIWRDRDGDGVAEDGEIFTLAGASVRSLNLTGTAVNGTSQLGDVVVINKGSYTRTDGVVRDYIDAALTYFSSATQLPDIAARSQSFERKAKNYRISFGGGAMAIGPKKGNVDPRAGALGVSNLMSFKGSQYGLLSPIILDLDGDGIEMKSIKKSKARFDMNGDGGSDDTGWIGKGDGFLVIDRNKDGLINDVSELSFGAENPNAASDLDALAALDNNGDKVIDAKDSRFGELKIWVDADLDGVTDAGELKTLAELGIKSIGLVAQHREGRAKLGENILLSTAVFTRENGSTGTLGNAALAYKPGTVPAVPTPNQSLLNALRSSGGYLSVGDPRFDFAGQYDERGLSAGRYPLMPSLDAVPLTFDTDRFPPEPMTTEPVVEPEIETGPLSEEVPALDIDPQPAMSADDLVASLRQTAAGILPDHAALAEWRRLHLQPVLESPPLIMTIAPNDVVSETGLANDGAAKAQVLPATVKMDQILASMVQEMAGFGADGAFDSRVTTRRDGVMPFDFFA